MIARLLALATALVVALTAPALATPHELTFAAGLDLTLLNPLLPEAAPNFELDYLTAAYLTRYTQGGMQPELLAVLPTQKNGGISADGKTITFTLRSNLKWSDGEPLTSADIAFTAGLIADQKTLTRYHPDFEHVASVDTPTPTTAVLHLNAVVGQALDQFFCSRCAPVLPKHLLAGIDVNTAPFMQLPVGAGPFRYVQWVRGERVILERNPNYALKPAKLDRIIFKLIPTQAGTLTALRAGEIEIATGFGYSDLVAVQSDPTLGFLTRKGVRPAILQLNVKRPFLRDVLVRQALRLATDRAAILQRSYLGAAVLSESQTSSADPHRVTLPIVPYDPKAAGALLDRAGWKLGADGKRTRNGELLSVEIIGGSGSAYVDQLIELVRTTWSSIGITVTEKRYPLSLMFAPAGQGGILFGGKFDVALFSYGEQNAASTVDGLRCGDVPPNGANFARWCDPAFDALAKRADATYDPDAAGALYAKAERLAFDAVPVIVVAQRNEVYPYRKDTVTGVAWWPYAFFFDFTTLDTVK